MSTPAETPPTRIERKRERTRRELLAAGRRVLAAKGADFTIRDVTAEADVAIGTFYNYFDGPDELVDAVMRAELLEISAAMAREPVEDPAVRIARTAARIFGRAHGDPAWTWLALRLVHRPGAPNQLNVHLQDDLNDGFATGRFVSGADAATLDLATGLLVMTLRRLVAGDADAEILPAAVARLLVALGIPTAEAETIARETND